MPFTLDTTYRYEEEIKKSRFEAIAAPVDSEDAVKAFLELHKDLSTTHQCWAWKIGHQLRFNDDGEPSGTAGRPILATIEGRELTNTIVLVNRWYGGIKLGTGGLVRAYGGCAGQCLLQANKIELIEKQAYTFICEFAQWSILQYELKQLDIEHQEHYQPQGIEVQLKLQVDQVADFALRLRDISRGRSQLVEIGQAQVDE